MSLKSIKFRVIGDLHGRIPNISAHYVEERCFDAIIATGDFCSDRLKKYIFRSMRLHFADPEYKELMAASKKVAKKIENALGVKRVALVMEGMGINHVHIKRYPMYGLEEKFKETWAKEKKFFERYEGYISTQLGPQADMDELKNPAEKIRKQTVRNR